MLRLAVAILMIFIQCFGNVAMARVVCFRGDGAICCITSAWASPECCERVVLQKPKSCKCCDHAQYTCNERKEIKHQASKALEFGPRISGVVIEAFECQPLLVMAILETSKLPEEIVLWHSLIFTFTEFVFGDGPVESTDWSILPSNPTLVLCRSPIMRC